MIDGSSINQTLEALTLQLEQFVGVAVNIILQLKYKLAKLINGWTWWCSPIDFTPLQQTLLKVLLFLLLITAVLIAYSWRIYGKAISDKFVRQSTLKEIEELKLSVAKLKLPKEHSPRI